MVSNKHSPPGHKGDTKSDCSFRFVTVPTPDTARDPNSKRLARSHAVKQALQAKRDLEQERGANFRVISASTTSRKLPRPSQQVITTPVPARAPLSLSLNSDSHDLFKLLAIDPSRLSSLLNHDIAKHAAEPIFSVDEEVVFQTFQSIFRADLNDSALSNAVMLTLVFGETGGSINEECLGYLNRATRSIYERMGSPDETASVAIIGAILLLAGVEARLGMRSQVELHMSAVHQLLAVCQRKHVILNCGIKRAIVWQDLNCSVMTGSHRMFDHNTFPELQWKRDPYSLGIYTLQPGFESRSALLGEEFIEVLEDLHGLRCIRESPSFACEDASWIMYIDSYQASVQSRLMSLRKPSLLLECCQLAASIAACQLCFKVWRATKIPGYVSSQLLGKLEEADASGIWDDHPDLLIWLLFMGGAFVPTGPLRSKYSELLKSRRLREGDSLRILWSQVVQILSIFIWSERVFTEQGKQFWEETM